LSSLADKLLNVTPDCLQSVYVEAKERHHNVDDFARDGYVMLHPIENIRQSSGKSIRLFFCAFQHAFKSHFLQVHGDDATPNIHPDKKNRQSECQRMKNTAGLDVKYDTYA
jgi:hypothetical protein